MSLFQHRKGYVTAFIQDTIFRCRAGETCPFLHDLSAVKPSQTDKQAPGASAKPENPAELKSLEDAHTSARSRQRHEGSARPLRSGQVPLREIATKPISRAQSDNPREFQVNQLRKRFSPEEGNDPDGLNLRIRLQPTDPDFPFELDALVCSLHVPSTYPNSGARPSIKVENAEMDRGYQINVEEGFDVLLSQFPGKTLLSLMNELDKNLERFLTSEKAPTIKLIVNKPRQSRLQSAQIVSGGASRSLNTLSVPNSDDLPASSTPVYEGRLINEAHGKRGSEIRQLEARLGRQPLFSKSHDGITFTVPVQFRSPGDLPASLQQSKTIRLIVPKTYHLDPCTVSFDLRESDDARIAEEVFQNEAALHPERTLLAHLNYFTQHATTQIAEWKARISTELNRGETPSQEAATEANVPSTAPIQEAKEITKLLASDRPHVQVIPRPPEWSVADHEGSDESLDSDELDDLSDEGDDDGGVNLPEEAVSSTPERGILLSFPQMELYGIELLDLALLSITIKCDRCKEPKDLKNVKPSSSSDPGTRNESCNKCANIMSASKCDAQK
ncbi:MAG: hypothetical protein Q9160_003754 [Pyrenula sp. 1 TL-2023]